MPMPKGIETRKPFNSELEYFKKNPNVAGMAAEDDKVIINPFSNLSEAEIQAVVTNESSRIFMRKNSAHKPRFDLTSQQEAFLDTTTYRNASEEDRKATIAARLLSNDPSGGISTPEQSVFVHGLRKALGI